MAEQSEISWTDATFNPWIGCTKISPACDHCYAERDFDLRKHMVEWGSGKPRHRTSAANWKKPLKWNREPFFKCPECNWRGVASGPLAACPNCPCPSLLPARRRVFCASLADVFDNEVDPAWRADLFRLIRQTPNLDWLLLTKRIGNATAMIDRALSDGHLLTSREPFWPWPNVWLGATICNQEEADRDIPKLLATPARVRFLSIEPMLGAIDLTGFIWGRQQPCSECPKDVDCECGGTPTRELPGEPALSWVIVGGESGPKARPMHPNWVRSIRDQCAAASVPFHFKQWGEWSPAPQGATAATVCHRFPDGELVFRVGKKVASRLLEGREHNEFPFGE